MAMNFKTTLNLTDGHIYLTGSNASSSTGNTTQLVFGTSSANHVVLSSNDNALVINPTTSTTTNQIILYLNQASVFPSGISANVTGNLTGNATSATTATQLCTSTTSLTSSTVDTILTSSPSLQFHKGDNTIYDSNDGLILTASWSSGYGAQIWLDDGSNEGGMAIRNRKSGGWNPWRQVLTSYNYSSYALPLSGGTLTGQIKSSYSTGSSWIKGRDKATLRNTVSTSGSSFAPIVSSKTQLGSWDLGPCHPQEHFYFSYATDTNYNANTNTTTTTVYIKNNGTIMGAAWNDYAEFRDQTEEINPGYCVISSPNGKVSKTTSRLCPCDGIVSDTYGFAIGETDTCKTPLATSGRVLAYYSGDIAEYAIGDAVCAGADGKISKMTREEIREWPDRIVGIVSEFPEYETWGSGNIKVDGRIWIKVR